MIAPKGTSKVSKPYKAGKKHTDYVLEIQNFGKTETIQIDIISNQEFTQVRYCGLSTLKVIALSEAYSLLCLVIWSVSLIRR